MKTIKIPECMNPFEVTINGKHYSYPAGTTQEVPDEVAAVIEAHEQNHKENQAASSRPAVQPVTHWVEVATIEMSKTIPGGSGEMPVFDFPVFNPGDTVKFKVGDTEYSLVAYVDESGATCVGHRDTHGVRLRYWDGMLWAFLSKTDTLYWDAKVETAHRLDEKFMPLLTDENGGKWKLTVSTSGALSAVKVDE